MTTNLKFYQGRRKGDDVYVHVKEKNSPWFKPLPHIEYHSPDGFEWGYPGSGPADLALAIMTDFFGEDPAAVQAYVRTGKGNPPSAVHAHLCFKDKFIAGLPKSHWRISANEIHNWFYREIGAYCPNCQRGMMESDGCRRFDIPLKDGSLKEPVKHGDETRADWGSDGKRCHDCGAKVGQYHHAGCDVEECPNCGFQLIGCDCMPSDIEEIEEIENEERLT